MYSTLNIEQPQRMLSIDDDDGTTEFDPHEHAESLRHGIPDHFGTFLLCFCTMYLYFPATSSLQFFFQTNIISPWCKKWNISVCIYMQLFTFYIEVILFRIYYVFDLIFLNFFLPVLAFSAVSNFKERLYDDAFNNF